MNETVLIQLYIEKDTESTVRIILDTCNFVPTPNSSHEFVFNGKVWMLFAGRMDAQAATILKLKNPDLAERMVVSYIPDNLKDKFRK